MRESVVIVGHGSRDPAANLEFETFVSSYRRRRADLDVSHGYVELAEPCLSQALDDAAREADRVVTVPLFLFAAGHVKNDLPIALVGARKRFPEVRFDAARALGVHPNLVDLAFERTEALGLPEGKAIGRTAVVVVGRGASDPDANGDFCKLVRLFGEGRGFGWVLPAFIGITRPLLSESLELLARARPARILVLPYFLFAGTLITKIRDQVRTFSEQYPWIRTEMASHLGVDEKLFRLLDERVGEARRGTAALPCDTCQYRVPVGGVTQSVGGVKALLWSLRHSFTHTQAMPHSHAHRALTKHVLVCGNVDCAGSGSLALLASVRRLLKDAGRERDILVTRAGCMGRCGEGPTVAIYPDGIWYRGVREEDAEALVHEHLLGDRLVTRLVDNIMQ
ncbi:MAG TPA: CbiX/SirB N-terminal domain-containing protein [Planctomycetota bacterium]|nr:CbiX/SirB N-terminal domain-containing protein [Planctomycetota bacterium]